MADVSFKNQSNPTAPPASEQARSDQAASQDALPYDLIELLFFAYRDFTGDPDSVLSQYGFGRAHHRVLHFVDRNPGLKVTDLLNILRITKQSLGRVLKQLVDQDFIEQRPGPHDRRQRRLHTTVKGHDLADRLNRLQAKRLERATIGLPDNSGEIVRQFLFQMIDPDSRSDVARLVDQPGQTPPRTPEK